MVAIANENGMSKKAGLLSREAFKNADTFPGRIEVSEITPGDPRFGGKERLHLAVRPLTFELRGEKGTGQFHGYYTVTNSKRSTFYHLVEGLSECGIDDAEPSDLQDKVFLWKREDIQFGTNRQTGEVMKSEGVLIPVKLLSDAEVAEILSKSRSSAPIPMPSIKASLSATFTEEELTAAADALDGSTRTAATSKAIAANLPRHVLQAIVDKSLFDKLIDGGYLTLDGQTFRRN